MPEQQQKQQNWKLLGNEVALRFKGPFSDSLFVIYFVTIIVFVGGLGAWISIVKAVANSSNFEYIKAVPQSLSTYLLAIIAAAFVDLSFVCFSDSRDQFLSDRQLSEADNRSVKRSLWMLGLSIFLYGVTLAVLSQLELRLRWIYIFSSFGTLLALFLWWIANYDNTKLRAMPSPFSVIGGEEAGNLKGDPNNINL